ncbi:unnamed protein product [Dimorphilus gyrociliatus]|uniref:Uncharacterized protein n=1 Tax=Dimorphilus gyrociliatus TaxID=2664684 RepID=A0A7I8VER0_9ANNE|nr:unnamed protein product [Dimorphilus gyrociliatus]
MGSSTNDLLLRDSNIEDDSRSIYSAQSLISGVGTVRRSEVEETGSAISGTMQSDISPPSSIRSLCSTNVSKEPEKKIEKKSNVLLLLVILFLPTILGFVFLKLQTTPDLKPNLNIDLANISRDLRESIIGQDDALRDILNYMEMYKKQQRIEPLVFLLHGPTGTGKSYTSQVISKSFQQTNVHLYVTSYHFGSKAKLLDLSTFREIPDLVKDRSTNLFIFDGLEIADNRVIEALFSTLHLMKKQSTKINYTVFLLIDTSKPENSQQFDRNTKYPEIEKNIMLKTHWFKEFMSSGMIDSFVPFQLLEKKHAIQCVILEAKKRGLKLSREKLDQIISSVTFQEIDGIEYSKAGCTSISNKLYLLE